MDTILAASLLPLEREHGGYSLTLCAPFRAVGWIPSGYLRHHQFHRCLRLASPGRLLRQHKCGGLHRAERWICSIEKVRRCYKLHHNKLGIKWVVPESVEVETQLSSRQWRRAVPSSNSKVNRMQGHRRARLGSCFVIGRGLRMGLATRKARKPV